MSTPTHRRWFGGLAALVVATGPAAAQSQPKPFPDEWFFEGAQRPAPLKELEGKPAADLTTSEWIGSQLSLKDQRGKVVVVDFWATWCGPCMQAIPENVEMVKKYTGQDLVFVGVHDAASGWDKAAGVVKDKSINYPVAHDKAADGGGGVSAGVFKVQFWPTYVVIDRAGLVRGAGLIPARVQDAVKLLLAESAPTGSVAAAEFAGEVYYGGATRPAALRALEGHTAPRLGPESGVPAEAWIGTPPSPDAQKGNVVVLEFFSAASALSSKELERLAALEKEMAPQGVVVVAVADGRATIEKVRELVKARNLSFPVLYDAAPGSLISPAPAPTTTPKPPADDPSGTPPPTVRRQPGPTVTAWGMPYLPTTMVIDRAGQVRAAGVRMDKVKPILEKLLAERTPTPPATAPGTP